MAEHGYNGWKNYETWNVALWLGNDYGSYLMVREMAQDAKDAAEGNGDADNARYTLAEALKDLIADEMAPDLGASMYADLLGAALSEVDWSEIATSILSEDA